MCQYCDFHFEENGDCWDRTKNIWTVNRPFGFTEIVQDTNMFVLSGDKDHMRGFNLNCEVTVDGSLDTTVFDTYIPIKYCPFCGRKLTFPDEEVEECPKQENTTL